MFRKAHMIYLLSFLLMTLLIALLGSNRSYGASSVKGQRKKHVLFLTAAHEGEDRVVFSPMRYKNLIQNLKMNGFEVELVQVASVQDMKSALEDSAQRGVRIRHLVIGGHGAMDSVELSCRNRENGYLTAQNVGLLTEVFDEALEEEAEIILHACSSGRLAEGETFGNVGDIITKGYPSRQIAHSVAFAAKGKTVRAPRFRITTLSCEFSEKSLAWRFESCGTSCPHVIMKAPREEGVPLDISFSALRFVGDEQKMDSFLPKYFDLHERVENPKDCTELTHHLIGLFEGTENIPLLNFILDALGQVMGQNKIALSIFIERFPSSDLLDFLSLAEASNNKVLQRTILTIISNVLDTKLENTKQAESLSRYRAEVVQGLNLEKICEGLEGESEVLFYSIFGIVYTLSLQGRTRCLLYDTIGMTRIIGYLDSSDKLIFDYATRFLQFLIVFVPEGVGEFEQEIGRVDNVLDFVDRDDRFAKRNEQIFLLLSLYWMKKVEMDSSFQAQLPESLLPLVNQFYSTGDPQRKFRARFMILLAPEHFSSEVQKETLEWAKAFLGSPLAQATPEGKKAFGHLVRRHFHKNRLREQKSKGKVSRWGRVSKLSSNRPPFGLSSMLTHL